MILLDTNVVSEPLKRSPEPRVTAWLDAQVVDTLYLPSTGLAELLAGLERLPDGTRKQALLHGLTELISMMIGPRVTPFDRLCAEVYSKLAVTAGAKGVVVSSGDGQIAAIAAVNGFIVASHDTSPFRAMGVPVIDPWTA